MKIGTLLRKLRDAKALSSRCLAERTGVSHSTYMDWEHDKSSPSLRSLIKLANALNIDPVVLMAYLTEQSDTILVESQNNSTTHKKESFEITYEQWTSLYEKNARMEVNIDTILQLISNRGNSDELEPLIR